MGGATRFDAFTAVPDPRTNSITVVGSEETFLFVQKVIDFVDVETPSDQKQTVRVFALEKANAAVVAEAINGFASGGAAAVGGGGRGGRGGGAAVGGRQLNVSAVADESSNSVMVYGRIEDIELV